MGWSHVNRLASPAGQKNCRATAEAAAPFSGHKNLHGAHGTHGTPGRCRFDKVDQGDGQHFTFCVCTKKKFFTKKFNIVPSTRWTSEKNFGLLVAVWMARASRGLTVFTALLKSAVTQKCRKSAVKVP